MQRLAPTEFKSCCASLYTNRALQFLLGPSLHPGGLDLTKQLARKLGVSESDTVLDLACGMGSTVNFLESTYNCAAVGIDLSGDLTGRARMLFKKGKLGFVNADGENLPFESESFSTVVSECSFCLMPNFSLGIRESLRVLKHGGRLGITDIAVQGPLPKDLDDVLLSFLCVTRNTTLQRYGYTLETEGFENIETSDQSSSLVRMLESIKKRLFLAELMKGIGKLAVPTDQIEKGKKLVALARTAVDNYALGYVMLTAQKP